MSRVTIRNATVIDCTGGPVARGVDVSWLDGRITDIGSGLPSRGGQEVDGTGRYLIPGLWETEAHVTRYSTGVPRDMNLDWPAEGSLERVRDNLKSYLANGVTTIVDLGGPPEVLSKIRGEQEAGELAGPRLLLVGRQLTAVGGQPIVGGRTIESVTLQVSRPGEAKDAVARAVEQYRIDAIKANYTVGGGPFPTAPMISRQILDALVEAGAEHGLPVLVHIDESSAALDAISAGVDNVEHMFLPDPERSGSDILEVAEACASRGVYWPFTLALWETLARPADESFIADLDLDGRIPAYVLDEARHTPDSLWRSAPAANVDHYSRRFEAAMDYVARVHAMGVRMTVATDAGNPGVFHGPSARRELALMVEAGMSCADALICATRNSAAKLRRDHDLGTVEVGKIADLVLLEADPLADITNVGSIAAVITGGAVFHDADLRKAVAA